MPKKVGSATAIDVVIPGAWGGFPKADDVENGGDTKSVLARTFDE